MTPKHLGAVRARIEFRIRRFVLHVTNRTLEKPLPFRGPGALEGLVRDCSTAYHVLRAISERFIRSDPPQQAEGMRICRLFEKV